MNSVLACQLSQQFALRRSNGNDIGFRKLRQPLRGTACTIVAAFGEHISDVVSGATRKEMLWVDTSGIIALVAHVISLWYRATKKLVGNSVCSPHFSVEPNGTVPTSNRAAGPLQASGLSIDFGLSRQSLFDRHVTSKNSPLFVAYITGD
jgi:hypothetical protein